MYVCVQLKRVSILKKYDEEIEGEKKSSFALGEVKILYSGIPYLHCLQHKHHCAVELFSPFVRL